MKLYKEMFEKWMNSEVVDAETKQELLTLAGNEAEIEGIPIL